MGGGAFGRSWRVVCIIEGVSRGFLVYEGSRDNENERYDGGRNRATKGGG